MLKREIDVEMNIPSTVTSYLLLGSAGARTPEVLTSNEITLVINAAKNFPATKECLVPQVVIQADDNPNYYLKQHFDHVSTKIYEEKEKGGKIFVHCIGGISRAPSLVMAYLMKYENMNLFDAHELLRKSRKFIRPNLGFWKQLIEYELELKEENSVELFQYRSDLIPSVYKDDYKNMVT